LYRAFGWNEPKFAHLPLILKPQGKGKLSKRDGDKLGFPVFPLQWKDPKSGEISAGYREDGYFPDAVVNMLALLGWNEGGGSEQEMYSLDQLVKAFSLEHVSKGGSKFDPEKTKWFQHHYMQEANDEDLTEEFNRFLQEKGLEFDKTYILKVIQLLKERATFVSDFWELGSYFFTAPENYDEKAAKKAWKDDTSDIIEQVKSILKETDDFSTANIQDKVKSWITSEGIGFGKVMQPFRLSLVGAMQGPDVFEIASAIGKEETLKRLEKAQQTL